jgi:hypothetical protein
MWSAGILSWVLAMGLGGCGGSSDNLPREAVSGSVTFGGEPLAKGTIQFAPTSDKLPTTATAGIVDGKYSIPRYEGLVAGSYKVAISSFDEVAPAKAVRGMPGKIAPSAKNLIPKQYNVATTLTKDVKAGETNSFEFDLSSTETTDVASKGNARTQRNRPGREVDSAGSIYERPKK